MGEKPSKVLTRSFMCTGLFNDDQGDTESYPVFLCLDEMEHGKHTET